MLEFQANGSVRKYRIMYCLSSFGFLTTMLHNILFMLFVFVSGNATYYNEGFNSTGTVSLKIPLPVIEDENTTLNASILFPDSPAENQQNFTYYYIFMQRNFRDDNWTTFACVQGNNSVSVVSRWSSDVGDMAQCLVELYSPDCSLIDNDTTTVTIAGKCTCNCGCLCVYWYTLIPYLTD